MNIVVPDEIMDRAMVTAADLLFAIASQLYADNKLDYQDALELSAMPPREFFRALMVRGIIVHQYPSSESSKQTDYSVA